MVRAMGMVRLSLVMMATLLVTVTCSKKLEGPDKVTVESQNLTYCGADQQAFVVRGEGLSPMVIKGAEDDPHIKMPTVCMTKVAEADGTPVSGATPVCIDERDVHWVSQNELRFIVRADERITPGDYDVVITNPDGTKATGGTIRIKVLAEGPLVFWTDPAVTYNAIATQITVYGANLGTIDTVALRDSESLQETVLCGGGADGGTAEACPPVDMQRQNRIQATVPSGLAPCADATRGCYDVVVRSNNGCQAELIRGMKVTANTDLVLTSIDPRFGWTDEATPVTINGEGFTAVPRVYLDSPETTTASPLSSVALVDDQTLTAVVPTGFAAGLYDVIVVNPDGRVGIIEDGFTITTQPPPVVANISPNYIVNGSAQRVTIEGTNFRNPTVTLRCQDPAEVESTPSASVDAATLTANSFDSLFEVAALPDGSVCVVTVTNDDQSYSVYSAVGISNPSLNLPAFREGTEMLTARRAPAVIAARATRSARFIYAIGGDDGSAANAFNTVETTTIDIFGNPGTWFQQPVNLPSGRTLSAVTKIGRFLYLVGGNDGAGPTASVLRAQVLDPLDAPEIQDVAARRGVGSEGIGVGTWYYRVSAVMGDMDPSNPGGETLASDPLAVSLPPEQYTDRTLVLTLFWAEVPGAQGYRIYRSPTGTEGVGEVQLVGTVTGGTTLQFEDTMGSGGTMNEVPRPLGGTGVWMALANLAEAREAPGAAAAQDPVNANQWYVYAVGGRAAGALTSTEQLNVAIAAGPPEVQNAAAAWVAGAPISDARSELTTWSITHSEAANVPLGQTYIYAGGGAESTSVDSAIVPEGGALVWLAAQQMSPLRAGYAGVSGAGFIIAFGGQNAGPDNGIMKGEVSTDPGTSYLINWNSEGSTQLLVPRYLAGGAYESAFVYLIGGVTTGGAPTARTERTVL